MIEISVPRMETVEKTSKLTGISPRQLRCMAENGEIAAIRVGVKLLINVDKLVEYLNTSTISDNNTPAHAAGIQPIPVKL